MALVEFKKRRKIFTEIIMHSAHQSPFLKKGKFVVLLGPSGFWEVHSYPHHQWFGGC